MTLTALLLGLGAGLASAPHCAAMCGPLAAFACGRGGQRALRYQLGRSAGYLALGALVGAVGAGLAAALRGPWPSALLSWSLALVLTIGAYRLWNGAEQRRAAPLRQLGKGPARRSWIERLLSWLPQDPLAVGLATALLPCGALAGAVVLAAGTGSPIDGALVMGGFSLTTAFGTLGAGWLASRLRALDSPWVKRSLAAVLAVGAVLLFVRPIDKLRGGGDDACCHGKHASASVSPGSARAAS